MSQILREDELTKAIREDADLVRFLKNLETAVRVGDGEFLRAAVDQETLMERIMDGVPEGRELDGLKAGFIKGTLRSWSIMGVLEAFSGKHYRFLRARTVGDWQGVLYRATDDDGLLNYHLHCLVRGGDGGYKIADTYVLGLSESVSASIRRGYVHLVEDHRTEGEKREGSVSVAFVKHLESIGKLGNALMNHRYAEALDLYH
ncbi:MAG: hypothetical protein P8J87_08885, partial [Verrucomicrobiales bacterium]|nr:hypothetical protein [Verrucomicrobiales bacterium]